jgi:hypothetical protein
MAGVRFPAGANIFLYVGSRSALELPSASYPEGSGDSFPGGKADYSSNAEVKNGGAIPPLPHVLMTWCLIN